MVTQIAKQATESQWPVTKWFLCHRSSNCGTPKKDRTYFLKVPILSSPRQQLTPRQIHHQLFCRLQTKTIGFFVDRPRTSKRNTRHFPLRRRQRWKLEKCPEVDGRTGPTWLTKSSRLKPHPEPVCSLLAVTSSENTICARCVQTTLRRDDVHQRICNAQTSAQNPKWGNSGVLLPGKLLPLYKNHGQIPRLLWKGPFREGGSATTGFQIMNESSLEIVTSREETASAQSPQKASLIATE